MRHYCSYFDHRYIPRALAMIRSLRRFDPTARFWVLCLDDACHAAMLELGEPGVRLISMTEFERGDAELLEARGNRTLIEYYFTCTPSLVRFVLRHCEQQEVVTYVDGDLYFFGDPAPLHEAMEARSVGLISHRFPESLRDRQIYGTYNVGWVSFRNDESGREAADWWREQCNAWCFDRVEDDRFADQKYLEHMAKLFAGVTVLRHEGANVAPWNLAQYRFSRKGGAIYVDDSVRLVFFHFHGIRRISRFCYAVGLRAYGTSLRGALRSDVYGHYLRELMSIEREVRKQWNSRAVPLTRSAQRTGRNQLSAMALSLARSVVALVRADAMFTVGGHAF